MRFAVTVEVVEKLTAVFLHTFPCLVKFAVFGIGSFTLNKQIFFPIVVFNQNVAVKTCILSSADCFGLKSNVFGLIACLQKIMHALEYDKVFVVAEIFAGLALGGNACGINKFLIGKIGFEFMAVYDFGKHLSVLLKVQQF
ncbi:hypothetical protein [Neisseria musculi]|uniref:hypothetical protein n=1 Tax=Neisseria musculi TaxID=1815583 RepID=UPI001BE4569F|nr:hypothetical protein [Neisseria musculi]